MEEFRDIPGYEGLYQVSNLGRVKSLGNDKTRKERILKQSIIKGQNRHYVNLYKNNIAKKYKVYQLVAMAFLNHTICNNKIVVDHKNNNPSDNRLENLQIITQRENTSKDKKNKTSKYTGVSWYKRYNKWEVKIRIKNKKIHLGMFTNEYEAHQAYQNKLKEISC